MLRKSKPHGGPATLHKKNTSTLSGYLRAVRAAKPANASAAPSPPGRAFVCLVRPRASRALRGRGLACGGVPCPIGRGGPWTLACLHGSDRARARLRSRGRTLSSGIRGRACVCDRACHEFASSPAQGGCCSQSDIADGARRMPCAAAGGGVQQHLVLCAHCVYLYSVSPWCVTPTSASPSAAPRLRAWTLSRGPRVHVYNYVRASSAAPSVRVAGRVGGIPT